MYIKGKQARSRLPRVGTLGRSHVPLPAYLDAQLWRVCYVGMLCGVDGGLAGWEYVMITEQGPKS